MVLLALLAAGQLLANSPWQLILKDDRGTAFYFDHAGKSYINNGQAQYVRISFLFSFDREKIITVKDQEHVIGSVIKVVAINCNTGDMVYIVDYFHKEKIPTEQTPVYTFRYDPSNPIVEQINKKSSSYKIACPFYV